jgi:enamine deaminase RidA (YjgF/YER057c/UK114 family)
VILNERRIAKPIGGLIAPKHEQFGVVPVVRPRRAFRLCSSAHPRQRGRPPRGNRESDCLAGGFCGALRAEPVTFPKERTMPKIIEHVHWPDAPDLWMPYAPAIKVRGGTTVYLAGVTAAPVYHHHPHQPEEFDAMPSDMEGQARAALDNLQRGLKSVGASFADIVTADRFVTDLSDQDALNRVWAEYFGEAKPTTTTVQVVRLATDPRCIVEINAIAVID